MLAMVTPQVSVGLFVNALGFQFIWWLLILKGDEAVPVALGLLFLYLYHQAHWVRDLSIVGVCAVLGYGIDALLTLAGVFIFPSTGLPPLWLATLWCAFAATLAISLRWFRQHLRLAALFGAIGGSASYAAAEALSAVSFGYSLPFSIGIVAVIWSLLLPFLVELSRRLEEAYD